MVRISTKPDISLHKEDIRYLCDKIVHLRNVHGQEHRDGIAQTTAKLYEAARTGVTALGVYTADHRIDVNLYQIDIEIDFVKEHVRCSAILKGVWIGDFVVRVDYDTVGLGVFRFSIFKADNAAVGTCQHFNVNNSEIMSYDMVFPAPSEFRAYIDHLMRKISEDCKNEEKQDTDTVDAGT